eukprot:6180083-Pleurochrysis_carterae.AAC.6
MLAYLENRSQTVIGRCCNGGKDGCSPLGVFACQADAGARQGLLPLTDPAVDSLVPSAEFSGLKRLNTKTAMHELLQVQIHVPSRSSRMGRKEQRPNCSCLSNLARAMPCVAAMCPYESRDEERGVHRALPLSDASPIHRLPTPDSAVDKPEEKCIFISLVSNTSTIVR